MALRNRKRAPRRGRKMGKKRYTGKGRKAGLRPTKQYATIVETLQANDVFPDTAYQATFNLSQFFRATTLAKNFQYYRAKKVKWEYMPLYNTFQENNSVAAVGKPQFYLIMNRDQDTKFSSLTSAAAQFSIQSAGADPSAFIKNREIIYKPNWCSPGLTAVGLTRVPGQTNVINAVYSLGMKKQYGWLPTPNLDAWQNTTIANIPQNPLPGPTELAQTLNGGVVYNGHNFYIQQDNDPFVPVGKCVCTVEWEFKGGKNLYANFQRDPLITVDAQVANKEAN